MFYVGDNADEDACSAPFALQALPIAASQRRGVDAVAPTCQVPEAPQSAPADFGEACVICCGGLSQGQSTRKLPCGHGNWHEACILQWLVERCTCPICRAAVPELDFLNMNFNGDPSGAAGAAAEVVRLLDTRARLAQRMAELDGERQALEDQVGRIELELATLRGQLARLHAEREALHLAIQPAEPTPRAGQQTSLAEPEEADVDDTESSVSSADELSHQAESQQTDVNSSSCAAQAGALLTRLRGAVLRAPLPATEVFRALSAGEGRLSQREAARVFRGLEASAPWGVVLQAFSLLDVNASGYIEEADWMSALQLPRMSLLRSRPEAVLHL